MSLFDPLGRALPRGIMLAATLTLCGCGVYLHRPALETATAGLKTDFTQLSAPAYLKAQEQTVELLAAREERAIAEYQTASRDFSLLNIVAVPGGDPGPPSHARLADAIGFELEQTLGTAQVAPDLAGVIESDRSTRLGQAQAVQLENRELRGMFANYREAGGKIRAADCAQLSPRPTDDPPGSNFYYNAMTQICGSITGSQAALDQCTFPGIHGRLGEVCASLLALRDEMLADKRRAPLLAAANALEAAAAGREREGRSPAQQYDRIVDWARRLPSNEAYQAVLTGLEEIFGADLTASLQDIAQVPGHVLDQPAAAGIRQALVFLGALNTVQAAAATAPLDQPSALLIGLAKARHDLNMVNLDIEQRNRLMALRQSQASALRVRAHYLVRAQARLRAAGCQARAGCTPGAQAFAESLSHYVSALDSGRAPFEILRAREGQLERSIQVRRAQATEADYRALLAPAIEQLAAYGAGGIRPDVLAPFLASLPVTGAILGR